MEELSKILVDALYLIAVINPISKVSVLSAISFEVDGQMKSVVNRSSIVAGLILLGTFLVGNFVLQSVFRIDVFSLRVAGGCILFMIGMNALRKGIFVEDETKSRINDAALVPLACPMIAGPASIAACITLRTQDGLYIPIMALAIAIFVNHIAMVFSKKINNLLMNYNLLGATIRITGLIVMSIGTQMVLVGLKEWLTQK